MFHILYRSSKKTKNYFKLEFRTHCSTTVIKLTSKASRKIRVKVQYKLQLNHVFVDVKNQTSVLLSGATQNTITYYHSFLS